MINRLLFILIITLVACQSPPQEKPAQIRDKVFKLGRVSFVLPEDYQVHQPDSLDRPGEGYIMKDGCTKLFFYIGGLGTLASIYTESPNPDYSVWADTLGTYLRLVGNANTEKAVIWTNVVNLKRQDTTLWDVLGAGDSEFFKDHRYEHLFEAHNTDPRKEFCLTKEEEAQFVKAFKELKID